MAIGYVDLPGVSGTMQEKIYEDAERLVREMNVAPALVAHKDDIEHMDPRQYNMRPKLNGAQELGEHDDLASPQRFDNIPGNIVTPTTIGEQVFITDDRTKKDAEVIEDVSFELASSLALQDEIALLNCVASFPEVIGDGSADLSLTMLRNAVTHLNNRGLRMYRKIAVLEDWQYDPIAKALDANSSPTNVSEKLKDTVQGAWYIRSLGDLDIYVTSNVVKPTAGTAKGGVFVRDAILYDERRAFYIEPQRDASARGVEMNAFVKRGIGHWAPNRGITLHTKITVPALS